jgi:hypothetical protein
MPGRQGRLEQVNDRMIVAELTGTARRYARWDEPDEETTGAAVAELRKIADGRTDLLAEVAGILLGTSEDELDELLARDAGFCCAAGVDSALIPSGSREEGRQRAATSPPAAARGWACCSPVGSGHELGSEQFCLLHDESDRGLLLVRWILTSRVGGGVTLEPAPSCPSRSSHYDERSRRGRARWPSACRRRAQALLSRSDTQRHRTQARRHATQGRCHGRVPCASPWPARRARTSSKPNGSFPLVFLPRGGIGTHPLHAVADCLRIEA